MKAEIYFLGDSKYIVYYYRFGLNSLNVFREENWLSILMSRVISCYPILINKILLIQLITAICTMDLLLSPHTTLYHDCWLLPSAGVCWLRKGPCNICHWCEVCHRTMCQVIHVRLVRSGIN